jgi:hypothetical protein
MLLIDAETEDRVRELASNCVLLADCLPDIFYGEPDELIYRLYRVVLVLPESDTNLVRIATDIEADMKSSGLNFSINKVRDEDMFLTKGKTGLLCCSLWLIAGSLLLNDVPIPLNAVERIIDIANWVSSSEKHLVLRKAGWFGTDFHIALLARCDSVGYLLRSHIISPNHNLEDILRVMKSNCGRGELFVTRF